MIVRVLALHVGCEACGETARIAPPDCDAYATWAEAHMLPVLVKAEALVDGVLRVRAIRT